MNRPMKSVVAERLSSPIGPGANETRSSEPPALKQTSTLTGPPSPDDSSSTVRETSIPIGTSYVTPFSVSMEDTNVASSGYVGKQERGASRRKAAEIVEEPTLQELLEQGYKLIEWDGRCVLTSSTICGIVKSHRRAGRPTRSWITPGLLSLAPSPEVQRTLRITP